MMRELGGTQRDQMKRSPIRQQLFQAKPEHVKARAQIWDLGLSDDRATRVGQVLGTIGIRPSTRPGQRTVVAD